MTIETDELWEQYAQDSSDSLQSIEECLLVLESNPNDCEHIHELYRHLHSIKGNSAIVQLKRISGLAHVAEDMVGLVRDHGVAVDRGMIDLMLEVVDRLRDLVITATRERVDAEEEPVAPLFRRAREWIWHHEPRHEEPKQSALEDDGLELWSESPPNEPKDHGPLEVFLALSRETLRAIEPDVKSAARKGPDDEQRTRLMNACADIAAAAERLSLTGVMRAVAQLSSAAEERSSRLNASFVEFCGALADVEREFHARTGVEFGIADTHRVARVWLERSGASLNCPAAAAPPGAPDVTIIEAPPASKAQPPPASTGRGAANSADFLRIDARKIATVMDLAGEIRQACALVTSHPDLEGLVLEGFSAAAHRLDMLIRELQNEVSGMRLVPIAGLFGAMKRVVRDTARRTGKDVELVLAGEDTEIDKVMLDQLHDPLVHILRNAVDHGVEPPEERKREGKPAAGRIVLEASHQAGEVLIRVSDDGKGLDRARILSRARERGLVPAGSEPTDDQIDDLTFAPGLSTKETADEVSGRGVGMDVVRTTIESMRGRVQVRSTKGHGSRVFISVPLTLAFVEAMVVRERDRLFALPVEKVFEVLQVKAGQVAQSSAAEATTIRIRDKLVPIVWLHEYYGERRTGTHDLDGRVVVVVQTSSGSIGLPVDALLGNEHIMLKPLNGVLANVRAAAGCGMLRSGDVALALDCERLA